MQIRMFYDEIKDKGDNYLMTLNNTTQQEVEMMVDVIKDFSAFFDLEYKVAENDSSIYGLYLKAQTRDMANAVSHTRVFLMGYCKGRNIEFSTN